MLKKKNLTKSALENKKNIIKKIKLKLKKEFRKIKKIPKIKYSPKKIKTKFIDPNSTLNPETNSDSPSIKSKGTLEVSHKIKI